MNFKKIAKPIRIVTKKEGNNPQFSYWVKPSQPNVFLHNGYIASSADLHVTGLPYEVLFTSKPTTWTFSGNYSFEAGFWDSGATTAIFLRFNGSNDNSKDAAISPKFHIPADVKTRVEADCCHYATSGSKSATVYLNPCAGTRPTSTNNGTSYKSTNDTGNIFDDFDNAWANLTLTTGNPYVAITHSTPKPPWLLLEGARYLGVQSCTIDYQE